MAKRKAPSKPADEKVEVIAIRKGYIGRIVEEGTKFKCPVALLSGNWMKRVDGEPLEVRNTTINTVAVAPDQNAKMLQAALEEIASLRHRLATIDGVASNVPESDVTPEFEDDPEPVEDEEEIEVTGSVDVKKEENKGKSVL